MQIDLACTELNSERYESRAVNDRLNECEGSSELREIMQRVAGGPHGVWGKVDGVFSFRSETA